MIMVKFRLIDVIDGFYYYEIYPEGDVVNRGGVVFNPETNELKKRTNPEAPYDDDKWIGHAISGMKNKDGTLKKSGMVAWY